MVKLIQLFIRNGLEEPLQAITKARVCFGLIRFAVDGNRHVAVDHFERPLRRHVLHLIVPTQEGKWLEQLIVPDCITNVKAK